MRQELTGGSGLLYLGNNIDILKEFQDNTIDSIITDPP